MIEFIHITNKITEIWCNQLLFLFLASVFLLWTAYSESEKYVVKVAFDDFLDVVWYMVVLPGFHDEWVQDGFMIYEHLPRLGKLLLGLHDLFLHFCSAVVLHW